MSRVAIVAAGGASSRTGLGDYTNKAALSLRGMPLLRHQVDFARRSGADRLFVVTQVKHVRLLASLLAPEERGFVAFLAADWAPGWASRVEHALGFVGEDDQVLVYSSDNVQDAPRAEWLRDAEDFLFTYTRWDAASSSPTNGPVFGKRGGDVFWRQYPGVGFTGNLFSGYFVARGRALKDALASTGLSERGEKEITGLIDVLCKSRRTAYLAYPGTYEDVSDLRALALIHAGFSARDQRRVDIGAGVLLSDDSGKVLLTKRQDGLGWVPPGGFVDEGESFVEAAQRELHEEAGIVVRTSDLRLLGVYPTVGKNGDPACSVIFHATVSPRPVVTYQPSECSGYGWYDRESAAGLVIPFDLDRAVVDYFDGKELDVR